MGGTYPSHGFLQLIGLVAAGFVGVSGPALYLFARRHRARSWLACFAFAALVQLPAVAVPLLSKFSAVGTVVAGLLGLAATAGFLRSPARALGAAVVTAVVFCGVGTVVLILVG